MRVGIMGGTLDPVHNGHMQIASAAREKLGLDRVMLLPAGTPPHKAQPISKEDRLQMVRLAAAETSWLFPCSIEIYRDGTTYTVDTLKELREKNPNTEWYYIIGADTLDVLDTWRNFGQVAKMCVFAVTGRAEDHANLEKARELEEKYGAKFVILGVNGPDIASSQIRKNIARGEDAADMLPASVWNYIKDRGLYLSIHSREKILDELKKNLKPSRFQHTIGVAETAKRLAPRFGIDAGRAELAGLLHDCAKYMRMDDMQKLVKKYVPDADEAELETASVLHAPAGAVLAKMEYGVQDQEILSAIRKHTLGDYEMKPLDALIYTADFIEPGRKEFPGLNDARRIAETDIYAAMRKCAQLTNDYLKEQGMRPHERSLAMLNTNSEL